jgi:ubiquinone/menaquinone biosynthesis C-methylase UbiE
MISKGTSEPMNSASESVVFDERRAESYDRTRSLSPETMAQLVDSLRAELRDQGWCLEVGVGTGRISVPLAQAGIKVVGIDLSKPMLRKLLDNRGDAGEPSIGLADAVALPFRDGTFGGAIACHVFHLIPRWKSAILELVRVIKPGGVILVELAGGLREVQSLPWEEIRERLTSELGLSWHRPQWVGLRDIGELDEFMRSLGARARELPTLVDRRQRSLEEWIEQLQLWVHGSGAPPDQEKTASALRAVQEWARERFGSLEGTLSMERVITWHAYDLGRN